MGKEQGVIKDHYGTLITENYRNAHFGHEYSVW